MEIKDELLDLFKHDIIVAPIYCVLYFEGADVSYSDTFDFVGIDLRTHRQFSDLLTFDLSNTVRLRGRIKETGKIRIKLYGYYRGRESDKTINFGLQQLFTFGLKYKYRDNNTITTDLLEHSTSTVLQRRERISWTNKIDLSVDCSFIE